MRLSEILKDSSYRVTQFMQSQIDKLEDSIVLKENKGKTYPT